MATYQRRPVTVEAFKLGTDEFPEWFMSGEYANWYESDGYYFILTLDGVLKARRGDYIIKSKTRNDIYPCRPEIFDDLYVKYDPVVA